MVFSPFSRLAQTGIGRLRLVSLEVVLQTIWSAPAERGTAVPRDDGAFGLRSRAKAMDEVSDVTIQDKAASRFACRRGPRDASNPRISTLSGRTIPTRHERLIDVATLGARASRPLPWLKATGKRWGHSGAGETPALPAWLRRPQETSNPQAQAGKPRRCPLRAIELLV